MEQIFYKAWSLVSGDKELEPLCFSNGKSQEDVVKEVIDLVSQGKKIIFLNGVCGTGKSAIALNIARQIGRASIVVPVKVLQQQYEQDYMGRKKVMKKDGKPMKISMIFGRDNFDSLFKDGSCSDPLLPEMIRITEKNYAMLKEYYDSNPFIESKGMPGIKEMKRMSVAPANPYWSPIVPAHIDLNLKDAKKLKYRGLEGKEFIFYQRKEGCGYYDQYKAYLDSDVIIFNSAKYKIEVALGRKPLTEVDIIDESDEFLDSFANQQSINLSKLKQSLEYLAGVSGLREECREIAELIDKENMARGPLVLNEDDIFELGKTTFHKILKSLVTSEKITDEVYEDESNYINKAIEVAEQFLPLEEEVFVTYKRDGDDLLVGLVTTNLSRQFKELADKNKVLVLMSGTLHDEKIIEKVFGVPKYSIVNAETRPPGMVEIVRTGKEFDCKYATFQMKKKTREDYLRALEAVIMKAPRPTLVHVNAFEDLPTEFEKQQYGLKIMTRGELMSQQEQDRNGDFVKSFKNKERSILYSTKCSRGVDFPGDTCNSVVFTKYPNPNMNDVFWKVLQKTHGDVFWEFYRDKAKREFLQRVYRALRSKEDHVYVLSPDLRVLDAAKDVQAMQL